MRKELDRADAEYVCWMRNLPHSHDMYTTFIQYSQQVCVYLRIFVVNE